VSDWTKLDKRLSDVLPKSDLDKHAWIFKTSRLLHAYLLREEVPKAFEPMLNVSHIQSHNPSWPQVFDSRS